MVGNVRLTALVADLHADAVHARYEVVRNRDR
jgi:hypothetical protein